MREAETKMLEESRMRREEAEGVRQMVETWVKGLPDVETREKAGGRAEAGGGSGRGGEGGESGGKGERGERGGRSGR